MYFPPNKVTVTPPSGKCSEHKDKQGEALIQVQAKNTQSQRQFEGKRMNSFEENLPRSLKTAVLYIWIFFYW